MKRTIGVLMALLATAVAACVPFEPTRPALKESDYTESGVTESVTMKDEAVRYNPRVLAVGTPRDQVRAAFGAPNASAPPTAG